MNLKFSKVMHTSQDLVDIQFELVGEWKSQNSFLKFEIIDSKKSHLIFPNALYAFIERNGSNDFIKYIGKTTQSCKVRFSQYANPGKGQKTNIRVFKKISRSLAEGNSVQIYLFKGLESLQWGGYSLNLAAGLEDSLVHELKPDWNIAGTNRRKTMTEEIELAEIAENPVISEESQVQTHFTVTLGIAYFEKGYMNPGIQASAYLGSAGESVELILPNGKNLKANINRTANSNGSVRLYFGSELSGFYQKNYKYGDTLEAIVKNDNIIELIGL